MKNQRYKVNTEKIGVTTVRPNSSAMEPYSCAPRYTNPQSLCLRRLLGTQCCQTNGSTWAEVLQYQLRKKKNIKKKKH